VASAGAQKDAAEWWRTAVFYQVYPRSFDDSNGDGVGDLPGILARLDHLAGSPVSLGVDAIWLSPTFPSPMADFGYDVADYCDVEPLFGTLADMDRLIAACHERGIRILLDWVPNHTSDQHPWFVESRSSQRSGRRDWYIWRDPAPDGSPPNNWQSVFGGPAWTFDAATGQYYLHSFLREQPDLNWRNPAVVEAMYETVRFWLRRGVDGFRIDVIGRLMKDENLADNEPRDPGTRSLRTNNHNHPDVYDTVRGIRRVFDEFPGAVSVGEVFGAPEEIAAFYGGTALDGLHLVFNFGLLQERGRDYTPWKAEAIAAVVRSAEAALPPGAVPCWALNNHDRSRFLSRHNHDGRGIERARAAVLLLLGLRGAPFLYYGEEIGMANVPIPDARLQDPARFHIEGRDPMRTPMQWDDSPGRGFSAAEPWLPYGPGEINVTAQLGDEHSLLSLYRSALGVRRNTPALTLGAHREHLVDAGVFAFERQAQGQPGVLVAVNTSTEPCEFALPTGTWNLLIESLRGAAAIESGRLQLGPLASAWLRAV
jgi:alpha-glucosidase